MAVQIDREVGRECGLVAVEWEQEGVSVRVSLVDYASDQKYGRCLHRKGRTVLPEPKITSKLRVSLELASVVRERG